MILALAVVLATLTIVLSRPATGFRTGSQTVLTIETPVDIAREAKELKLWALDENDPPGIAHVPLYHDRGPDGRHFWDTNVEHNWSGGLWVEAPKTSWRVSVSIADSNMPSAAALIKVGSVVVNSGPGLLPAPDGKFAKLELYDARGKPVPARLGSARKLYWMENAGGFGYEKINLPPKPSWWDSSVEEVFPDTISDLEYSRGQDGSFSSAIGFASNGPPCQIGFVRFNDIFAIKDAGDYSFTVQPVLYRMHCDGGTYRGYLNRIDLPSITTEIHLVPNGKKEIRP